MRISHDFLNDEIQQNIVACIQDLRRVGVYREDDSLICKACELYCKWQQDYQGKAKQYEQNYEKLRDALSLAGEYRCTTKL